MIKTDNTTYTIAVTSFFNSTSIFQCIPLEEESCQQRSNTVKYLIENQIYGMRLKLEVEEQTKLLYASKNPASQAMARL